MMKNYAKIGIIQSDLLAILQLLMNVVKFIALNRSSLLLWPLQMYNCIYIANSMMATLPFLLIMITCQVCYLYPEEQHEIVNRPLFFHRIQVLQCSLIQHSTLSIRIEINLDLISMD